MKAVEEETYYCGWSMNCLKYLNSEVEGFEMTLNYLDDKYFELASLWWSQWFDFRQMCLWRGDVLSILCRRLDCSCSFYHLQSSCMIQKNTKKNIKQKYWGGRVYLLLLMHTFYGCHLIPKKKNVITIESNPPL